MLHYTLPVNGIPHNQQVNETESDPDEISDEVISQNGHQHVMYETVDNISVENEDLYLMREQKQVLFFPRLQRNNLSMMPYRRK